MGSFPPPSSSPSENPVNAAPGADPRLQPTPDYGTLGPGSDVAGTSAPQPARQKNGLSLVHLVAVVIGMVAALIAGGIGKATSWRGFSDLLSKPQPEQKSEREPEQIDRMAPQKQAETLLEMAVSHSDGAVEQISSRAQKWPGQVKWNTQIANLTTAALNSDDLRVRQSGVEVELAAYGVTKDEAGLNYVLGESNSEDHATKVWAL